MNTFSLLSCSSDRGKKNVGGKSMKTIYLIRHGKAVQKDAQIPDFQRKLVKKGQQESLTMAKKMKKAGIYPDLLISSSADRALETAHIFAERLGYPKKKILVKDSLYNEIKPEGLLVTVQGIDNQHNSIMLFGHDPLFTYFAAFLLEDFNEGIPKSGIVCVDFRNKTWKGITKGNGRLKYFDFPKQVSKAYKVTREEMKSEISARVKEMLANRDAKCAEMMEKTVDSASEKLARDFVKAMKTLKIKEKDLKIFKKAEPPRTPTRKSLDLPSPTAKKPTKKKSAPAKLSGKTPPKK